jgi:hypothetical protein
MNNIWLWTSLTDTGGNPLKKINSQTTWDLDIHIATIKILRLLWHKNQIDMIEHMLIRWFDLCLPWTRSRFLIHGLRDNPRLKKEVMSATRHHYLIHRSACPSVQRQPGLAHRSGQRGARPGPRSYRPNLRFVRVLVLIHLNS